jgi:hypothetical protein
MASVSAAPLLPKDRWRGGASDGDADTGHCSEPSVVLFGEESRRRWGSDLFESFRPTSPVIVEFREGVGHRCIEREQSPFFPETVDGAVTEAGSRLGQVPRQAGRHEGHQHGADRCPDLFGGAEEPDETFWVTTPTSQQGGYKERDRKPHRTRKS